MGDRERRLDTQRADRRRPELAPHASDERFRSAFEHASVGMAMTSLQGCYIQVNATFCEITGYEQRELLATDFQSITHPDDVPENQRLVQRILDGEIPGSVIEKRYVRKNGDVVWVKNSMALVRDGGGKPASLVALVQNVTANRQAEDALRESEERYRMLVETAREMIITIDCAGRFTSFNAAFEALTGWPNSAWIGRAFIDIVHPDDVAACTAVFEAALRGETTPSVTHRVRTRAGEWLTFESTGTPQFRDGRVVAVLGLARDVTDRARAEEELRRSQRLFEEAQQVAHVGYWEWELETDRLTWSDETYRLFGTTPQEFQPSFAGFLERVHPDDRALIRELNERTIREGGDFSYDGRILRPSGEVRFIHVRGHAECDARGRATRMMGICQDITDRKRDDEVRARLLNRVISIQEEERTRLSRELHDGPGQSLTALLVGLRRVEDARSLTEAQLAVARQRELTAQIIEELSRMARGLRPTVLDDVGLVAALRRYTADRARLFGFEVRLEAQALGRRRLPQEVETALYRIVQEALSNAARHGRPRLVRVSLGRRRDVVQLIVKDDGCGFDVRRTLSAGDHLGLHAIRERASLLGGLAEIRSQPGQGTTVTVVLLLPRGAAAGHRTADRPRRSATAARRGRQP
jgi:PAS domain S-box-containing protein